MRDKASNGQTDPTRDHHMINGTLVPVEEPARARAGKARSTKRQKPAKLDKHKSPAHAATAE
jgi:hypothetical protein